MSSRSGRFQDRSIGLTDHSSQISGRYFKERSSSENVIAMIQLSVQIFGASGAFLMVVLIGQFVNQFE
jgi:hypothetical protein